MVGSAAALWAPASWTRRLTGLVQWVAPFQEVSQAALEAVAPGQEDATHAVTAEEAAELRRTNEAFQHQTAGLSARIEELEAEVRGLTATRSWDADGRKLGSRGRLIPARVLGEDVVSWRSSRLLSAGTWHGAANGAAVVSRLFTVNQGEDAGVRSGLAILLGETLVGFVESTGTHVCRALLLSDLSVQMKVRIGRFTESGFTLRDGYFWLHGAGAGRMVIRDVDRRLTDAGAIQVGDRVLSDSQSDVLPAALTIGRISEITPDRDNPLFAILEVRGAMPEEALRRVYIYDPLSAETK